MTEKQISVRKNTGESDIFDPEKLRSSLQRSGAKSGVVEEVLAHIHQNLYNGISTREIYDQAHRHLKKHEANKASRYKLKQAILELGPTGYPFELFVGELLKAEGYEVKIGEIHQGKCVSHEVDVLAENPHEMLMMECKFHNRLGYKTDVKVPLYIDSRFRDLESAWKEHHLMSNKRHQGGVITNARLTQDAITYGECAGLRMISWDYPHSKGLKDQIDTHKLYPVTSLNHLTKHEKQLLLNKGIVTVKSLCNHFNLLDDLQLKPQKLNKVMEEANLICEL